MVWHAVLAVVVVLAELTQQWYVGVAITFFFFGTDEEVAGEGGKKFPQTKPTEETDYR